MGGSPEGPLEGPRRVPRGLRGPGGPGSPAGVLAAAECKLRAHADQRQRHHGLRPLPSGRLEAATAADKLRIAATYEGTEVLLASDDAQLLAEEEQKVQKVLFIKMMLLVIEDF